MLSLLSAQVVAGALVVVRVVVVVVAQVVVRAVCTVTQKKIQDTCDVQQCRNVVPHREVEGDSFVMSATDCGFVSMQSCKRKAAMVGSVQCPTSRCEDTCWLSEWSSWSTCSKSCAGGKQSRTRSVVRKEKDGVCLHLVDERACNTRRCAGDCVVGEWSAWSACSHSCGNKGRHSRTRTAFMPANVVGGLACPHKEESEACVKPTCMAAGWHKQYVKKDDGTQIASGAYHVCSHTKCEVKCPNNVCRTYVYDWHHKEANGGRHHCISKKAEGDCVCVCSDQFERSKVVHIVKFSGESKERVSQWDVSASNADDNKPTHVDPGTHIVEEKIPYTI